MREMIDITALDGWKPSKIVVAGVFGGNTTNKKIELELDIPANAPPTGSLIVSYRKDGARHSVGYDTLAEAVEAYNAI